ncbi:hypothetical protein ABIE26_005358 [Pedobacter africanus]|uniref:Uncharacterized protein n=1 Tax=Pedobacter africanus TaxID=151894 RepID=A0ACC6L4V5_9SPHI|nr:RagB/SusD family nutrient uptake outer membrane protein [Pedobacter africanus]MDR6786455.1 hypothetical protein [Pedobacter africanus]
MKRKTRVAALLCITALFFIQGCKKFVEVEAPKTSVNSINIYNNDATAIGAITSLYASLGSEYLTGTTEFSSLSCIVGLSADELTLFPGAENSDLYNFYQNSLTSSSNVSYLSATYNKLYLVNESVEGLTKPSDLTPQVKKQLLGEAKFMRAFYYFYLVNIYGEIPLILSTDYSLNTMKGKSSQNEIYNQIIVDLKEAKELLSDLYVKGDGFTPYPNGVAERIRPTKWAAISLLARAYLYMKNYTSAEAESTLVLSNTSLYKLETLDKVYLKNNMEAILQLQPVTLGNNTQDANIFLLPSSGPSPSYPVYLSEELINKFSSNDERKNMWIRNVTIDDNTYFYPFKYKVPATNITNNIVTEYPTVMRLAEQFLIRAEARAQLNNLFGAISDVDEIRRRAGLELINDIDPLIEKAALVNEITKQRQLELFTEWGHRWFDLKRRKLVDEVMSIVTPKKGNTSGWKSYQEYFPIPISILNRAPNLTPTDGY